MPRRRSRRLLRVPSRLPGWLRLCTPPGRHARYALDGSRSSTAGSLLPRWLQDQRCRLHDRSVPTGGYAERPELSRLPGLGNVDSPQGGGPVGPLLECLGDLFQEGVHSGGLDVLDADAVDTGGSPVLTDFSPGPGKHVGAADLVVEGMEPAVWVLLGTAAKRVGEGS